MGKRKVENTVADATLPRTPIEIGGKTYNLCFDLGALAEAETAINAELLRAGRSDLVNLLVALPNLNLANIRVHFAAALRKFHPEISYDEAVALITPHSLFSVAETVSQAWAASAPDAQRGNPHEPSE